MPMPCDTTVAVTIEHELPLRKSFFILLTTDKQRCFKNRCDGSIQKCKLPLYRIKIGEITTGDNLSLFDKAEPKRSKDQCMVNVSLYILMLRRNEILFFDFFPLN